MRSLRQEECELLLSLLNHSPEGPSLCNQEGLYAVDLKDGGMGSIRITRGQDPPQRRIARELVTATYTDEDGVLVYVSLNNDQEEQPFEIDIWKVDFSPLRRYPRPLDLRFEGSQSTAEGGSD
jgi:hypothetical protein